MKVNFKRILCATDLSDHSNEAVRYGVMMAHRFEATLYVCHVIHSPYFTMHGTTYSYQQDFLESMREGAHRQLETLMSGQEGNWETRVFSGPVATTLHNAIQETKSDLMVVATHGRSGIKRMFLGSVTEWLIKHVTCPLLIVTPADSDQSKSLPSIFQFDRIMVGCDFSPDSGNALQYGLSLAQEFQSELHLVHVVEPISYRKMLLPDVDLPELAEKPQEAYNTMLQGLVPDEVKYWCEVKTKCLIGRPFEKLISYADSNAIDLIILGIRGHGLMESMLVGSTADRVIRHAHCPVLAVYPQQDTESTRTVADEAVA